MPKALLNVMSMMPTLYMLQLELDKQRVPADTDSFDLARCLKLI